MNKEEETKLEYETSPSRKHKDPEVWDEEIWDVGNRRFKFRQIPGIAMKKLQRSCRNPRSGDLDDVRFFQRLCEEIIVAEVDQKGNVIPNKRFDPSMEPVSVCNEVENALMSFLGY